MDEQFGIRIGGAVMRLWLELKILWARLCGWRVVREDVFGDIAPEYAGPGEKLWIIGNLVGGYDHPALTSDGGTVFINGNICGDWNTYAAMNDQNRPTA